MKFRIAIWVVILACAWCGSASAQFGGWKSLAKKAVKKTEDKNEQPPPESKPAEQPSPDATNGSSSSANTPAASNTAGAGGQAAAGAAASQAPGTQPQLVSVPIDFVPGEKTIFYDDFSDMPPGEPPPHWTVRDGMMQLRMGGGIRELYTEGNTDVNLTSPSFVIPTNFTLQVTCVCKGRSNWEIYDKDGTRIFGAEIEGSENYETINATVGGPDGLSIGNIDNVKVVPGKPDELDLWAQQGRVRAYLNGQRFADVNNVKFGPIDHLYANDFSYRPTGIRSIRIAEAAPDPAEILATTGKYVTHGIYFDTGSDVLKPESAGVIKEISSALYKNPGMKVEIDGYTDSTGDAAHNLDLSKRRAAAVMNVLVSQFGIDQGRLTSNGFGAANPIASNDTADGRSQNRRVEFVKK
jgi:OmpA-OmpF porin, OOP family